MRGERSCAARGGAIPGLGGLQMGPEGRGEGGRSRGDVASLDWPRAVRGGGAANGTLPSGEVEVEGAGKQGGGGWIWLVARFSRGMRRLRVGEG